MAGHPALDARWYCVVNDEIGGWSIATADKLTTQLDRQAGEVEVATFVSKEAAEHIVELHNYSLDPAFVASSGEQDVIDMGYLSLPADLQRAIEEQATTVPPEAYDARHPDHFAWVRATGRCHALGSHPCPLNGRFGA